MNIYKMPIAYSMCVSLAGIKSPEEIAANKKTVSMCLGDVGGQEGWREKQ